MTKLFDFGCDCTGKPDKETKTEGIMILPSMDAVKNSGQQPVDLKEYSRPGYNMCSFVQGFVKTDAGPVPRVKSSMDKKDVLFTALVRTGIHRHDYKVAPGLYCVGNPDKDSEVLVTANFKLTFDHLRRELEEINAWILVLDTNGVNVWCAAGKKTFSTQELVKRVKSSFLDQIVAHRRLIVPQLGATGISARDVKKASGFEVVYGPVRAKDIPLFLKNNRKADDKMRKVTFTFVERLILTPVELNLLLKPALIIALLLFFISGIGPGFFSFPNAWSRGLMALFFFFAGIISGVIVTPALLPFIPFKEFAAKGIISGIVFALLSILIISPEIAWSTPMASMALFTVTISSILSMHFTGATPFTSPSGVEKEMRRFLPVQAISLFASTGIWIYSAF
jgi:hypothetical protein